MMSSTSSIAQYIQNPSLLSIEAQWNDHIASLKERLPRSTVFGLRFVKNQQYLVGCTSLGCILVWTLPSKQHHQFFEGKEDEDHDTREVTHDGSPTLQFNLPGLPTLYTMETSELNDDNKLLLLVGGDGGVFVVDWEQQVKPHLATAPSSSKTQTQQNTSNGTLVLDLIPCQHLATHKNPWEGNSKNPEVNSVCYTDGYIWGAAGDAFGCYKWNTETGQPVATYAPVRKGATLYTVTTARASTLCCIGGDHGTVELWDCKADRRLEVLPPPSPVDRVMCSTLTSDNSWWTVGGAHGLATLHLPTRRWVPSSSSSSSSSTTTAPTQDTIQDMTTTKNGSLITVGTDGVVSHWPRSFHHSEPPAQRVLCHTSNGFAVTASTDGHVAVGGVGDTVDVFYASTVPYCQLSTSTT